MFSAMLAAEEEHRVEAVLAFDRVVAVAGVPLEDVISGAHEGDVVAVVAENEVVAVAADERVGALAAEDGVVAGAAVERELHDACRQGRGRDPVVAAKALDDEAIVGALGTGDIHLGRKTEHGNAGAGAEDVDDVVTVGAVDTDSVGRAIACRTANRAGEADVHLRHVGATEVVDDDVVGATERVDGDLLEVVDVHDDVAKVAGQQHPLAIGRDGEVLGAVGAVEQHLVDAVLTFHRVRAVARIPLEDVVAGAEEGNVVALLAVDEIVAVAAEEQYRRRCCRGSCRCRRHRRP